MRWMITDSGLGGLSVCAGLERALTKLSPVPGIELLYVNATPEDLSGYNSLKTQSERIALFDRFLKAVYSRFVPDEIAIACNTLSVIFAETEFAKKNQVAVEGIVEAGVELSRKNLELHQDDSIIIFATETTTEANTYPRLINVAEPRLVAQACPELAHAISNDASGRACRILLSKYVAEALGRFDKKPESLFAFLGCTHYGYQAELFKEIIESHGVKVKILNPNDLLIQQLVSRQATRLEDAQNPFKIEFVSRYPIPHAEIDSMEKYLKNSAPLTLAALKGQVVVPDLFQPF